MASHPRSHSVHDPPRAGTGPLSQSEYEAIYARVPRLTVELVLTSPLGVLLARRTSGACQGLWNLPGGTVRYGERLADAVRRVGLDEVAVPVEIERMLGYIEYPSHLERGIDWPIGIAFLVGISPGAAPPVLADDLLAWFTVLPDAMHEEQRTFLTTYVLGA